MVIITEGEDDKKFLISLLQHLRKNHLINVDENFNFNNIIEKKTSKSKLLDVSSYDKLKIKIETKNIQKLLFIFDSDFEKDDKKCNGFENSKKCIEILKKDLNLDVQIDYYIFHRNLDYFLLTTINNAKCYNEFESLHKCLNLDEVKPNKKPVANMYRELYPYPQFDFNHKQFDDLKQKLQNLFEKQEKR